MTMSVKLKPSSQSLSGLYLLLAELIQRELDPQLRELLLQPEVFDVFVKIAPECRDYLTREWTASDYEEAAVDFCDLFVLPESGSAPRAAAWLDIGGDLTAEAVDTVVHQFLSEWKIEVPRNYQYLAYDHVSLMLYLYVVISEREEYLGSEFKNAVLSPWLPRFGESLKGAKSPIYRAISSILVTLSE